jgi:hypothetical protein
MDYKRSDDKQLSEILMVKRGFRFASSLPYSGEPRFPRAVAKRCSKIKRSGYASEVVVQNRDRTSVSHATLVKLGQKKENSKPISK